jgi:sulfhydrogenase subunit beta (sulfur reductase)
MKVKGVQPMKKVTKSNLVEVWRKLASEAKLYIPVDSDGVVNFSLWQEGAAVDLEALNTFVPPKKLFFPRPRQC